MLTRQQVLSLDLGSLTGAGDGWGDLMGAAHGSANQVTQGLLLPVNEGQTGETVKAVTARLTTLQRNYQYVGQESGMVRSTVAAMVEELTPVRRKLSAALEDARSRGFTVGDDNSVTCPPDASEPPPVPAGGGRVPVPVGGPGTPTSPAAAEAQDIADRIAAALGEATEIDERFAHLLGRLKAQHDYKVTDATWSGVESDGRASAAADGSALHLARIPGNDHPRANSAWWKGLSPEQRQEYIALYPDRIGGVDGLPTDVRDQANRVVLSEQHADAVRDLAALGPEPRPEDPFHNPHFDDARLAWQKRHGELEDQLTGMDAIQQRLDGGDQVGAGAPPAYLLKVDRHGIGRAIVAFGNPDTADHTAVYVPGTTSNLPTIGGDLDRMQLVQQQAARSSNQQVSTITWLGYDAPQSLITDAPRRSFADNAAPDFDHFVTGLRGAHDGPPTHMTAIGHSYGSTVVGSAAVHGHLEVDDMVVAGSPGMEAPNADALGVGDKHFWSETAVFDPVPDAGGVLSPLPARGVHHGELDLGVPGHANFGGHKMATDTFGHTNYWKPDSLSLRNQAAVVAGRYDLVVDEDAR